MQKRAVVGGAGGFIGHHLVKYLKDRGYWVRGVDIKEPEYEPTAADEFMVLDLREYDNCLAATADVDEVYQLAADMGGIGYITGNHADIARNNVLINAHMLEAALPQRRASATSTPRRRASTRCTSSTTPTSRRSRKRTPTPPTPRRATAGRSSTPRSCASTTSEEGKLDTRVARFHNIYGPLGTYDGGREKAPAAISRKVALAARRRRRSRSGATASRPAPSRTSTTASRASTASRSPTTREPLNLGSDRARHDRRAGRPGRAEVAGKTLVKRHDLTKPQGVRGRNSDNDRCKAVLAAGRPR